MSASSLSPRETMVYRLLEEAANDGRPCPTNAAIAQTFEGSASDATYILRGIEQKGLIRVDRFNRARRVTIVATGRATEEIKGVPNKAPETTGADLVRRLRRIACEKGVPLHTLCAPLTGQPSSFVAQLERAQRPSRSTLERVTALLEGRQVPARPQREKPTIEVTRGPVLTIAQEATMRVDRDPCPRCGVRRDIGCDHTTRAISSRVSQWA
ncbi:DNA-binding MarR family transcriptional regulator [Sphingomonas kyeonggiensis]|uniref:hypothetical protein n=1 Tax=Sphingomonas kyeonggiensis TaxID=1268553 RepID=UPI00277F5DA0|nr:hypothetical protein [Sphingomonas kyeonggiensis]MDQ0250932.1 DNA-binding MarR family transcriptional regulator [Sphingomonas kyeonggiensis]